MVEVSSWRAAGEALGSSVPTCSSFVEQGSMAEGLRLRLNLGQYRQIITFNEHIPSIFECGQ